MTMRITRTGLALLAAATCARAAAGDAPPVSLTTLLAEMTDRAAVARWPAPLYESLQASSYNRASTHRDAPGWFADQDGLGFIRTETIQGRTEWVVMEHDGPGCLTKMWTPFFYFGFGDHTGPNIRIYLDGATNPVIDEGFIALTRGQGSFPPPFGAATARAGNTYLPIPFARSCKVTFSAKPFYNIINYRAYPPGTPVETITREALHRASNELAVAGKRLYTAAAPATRSADTRTVELSPAGTQTVTLAAGPAALALLRIRLPEAASRPALLRSTVLAADFDGTPTMWLPVGDLFSSPDALHPFRTWERTVESNGTLSLRWLMPYQRTAALRFENHGAAPVAVELETELTDWTWDDRSMHFHAGWRPDDLIPGTPFLDWNFVDIRGRGVFVGDAWTVLNPTQGWWGEGDEKIYVDGAWERGFPTHFGTGTEDYYGWAGGEVPTRRDEFDEPFLANVRVGGVNGNRTRGFNICTRTRVLDAIPFEQRLRFDMEASAGTDQRRASDVLGYSAVTFWYARPGATNNASPQPGAAGKPIMSLADLAAASGHVAAPKSVPGAIEFEALNPTAKSPGLACGPQRPAESMRPAQWSGERHLFIPAAQPGDFVEFTLSEQFGPRQLVLFVTKSFDFGVARISVNGRPVVEDLDLFSPTPKVEPVALGRVEPVNNAFVIRCELTAPNLRSRGARTFMGLDYLHMTPP
jgi:hypothetical protein